MTAVTFPKQFGRRWGQPEQAVHVHEDTTVVLPEEAVFFLCKFISTRSREDDDTQQHFFLFVSRRARHPPLGCQQNMIRKTVVMGLQVLGGPRPTYNFKKPLSCMSVQCQTHVRPLQPHEQLMAQRLKPEDTVVVPSRDTLTKTKKGMLRRGTSLKNSLTQCRVLQQHLRLMGFHAPV